MKNPVEKHVNIASCSRYSSWKGKNGVYTQALKGTNSDEQTPYDSGRGNGPLWDDGHFLPKEPLLNMELEDT